RLRDVVERLDDDALTLRSAIHPRAYFRGARFGKVERDAKLLDARERPARALGGHRIDVHAPIRLGPLPQEPLGVACDDATLGSGLDRIEACVVDAWSDPRQERRVFGGALVDVALVLSLRRFALLDLAPDDVSFAIDAESVKDR